VVYSGCVMIGKKQPIQWYCCTATGEDREWMEGFDANDAIGIAKAIPKCILEAIGKYDHEFSGLCIRDINIMLLPLNELSDAGM